MSNSAKSEVLLEWKRPVQAAKFLRRYKRFFADVELPTGEVVIAHVANSGSMKSCNAPGTACLISFHDDPTRKLKYTLEAIATPEGGWIGVNTSYPNQLAEKTFLGRHFPHWHIFDGWAREVKISENSRTDLVLWKTSEFTPDNGRPLLDQIRSTSGPRFHFVEVKNVSLAEGSRALFPDSVTERGLKHVHELSELLKLGHTAEFFFVIQRTDIDHFTPAHGIDPAYASALVAAQDAGLVISPHIFEVSEAGFRLHPLQVKFLAR